MKKILPKIFISYTLKDGVINREFLEKLDDNLKNLGLVYIDLIHNDSNNKQARVVTELEKSDLLILIKTVNINNSEWVDFEINYAKNNNIPICKIEIEKILNNEFQPITKAIRNAGFIVN